MSSCVVSVGFESRPLRDLTDENRKVLVRWLFAREGPSHPCSKCVVSGARLHGDVFNRGTKDNPNWYVAYRENGRWVYKASPQPTKALAKRRVYESLYTTSALPTMLPWQIAQVEARVRKALDQVKERRSDVRESEIVTRDSMIGTGLPKTPGAAS